ncbi:MAG: BatD family protein [Myxococcota bacterium]
MNTLAFARRWHTWLAWCTSLCIITLLVSAGRARAGELELRVTSNATRVQEGDVFQVDVTISISGMQQDPDELVLPDMSAFEVVRQERGPTSQQTTIINGNMTSSRRFGFVFHLKGKRSGKASIGEGRVRAAGQSATSKPLTIDVVPRPARTAGDESSALDPSARFAGQKAPRYFVDARLDRDEAYLGEQVTYTVAVYATEYIDLDLRGLEAPKPSGFWSELLENATRIRPSQRVINGTTYLVYEIMKVALFPLEVGAHTLDPIRVTVLTAQGTWGRRNEVQVSSEPIRIVVNGLPAAGRPVDFPEGNVGRWQLRAEVSEPEVPLGQPFTLAIKAGGEGHLQALSLPDVSGVIRDARLFPPTTHELKAVEQGRLIGEKKLEVLVQPNQAGVFLVPAFTLPYFDPEARAYVEATSDPLEVRVTAAQPTNQIAAGNTARTLQGTRPLARGLVVEPVRVPLPELWWFRGLTLLVVGSGAAGFLLGVRRARAHARGEVLRAKRAKARHHAVQQARQDRDMVVVERVLYEALAERCGEQVKRYTNEEIASALTEQLGGALGGQLAAWFGAAQNARYAPRGAADKRGLFDDAEQLLKQLEDSP